MWGSSVCRPQTPQQVVGGAGAAGTVLIKDGQPQQTPDRARAFTGIYELPRGPQPVG